MQKHLKLKQHITTQNESNQHFITQTTKNNVE